MQGQISTGRGRREPVGEDSRCHAADGRGGQCTAYESPAGFNTDSTRERFFVRHAYFLGGNDPYKSLKTTLKAEIDPDAWETLHSDTPWPFEKPSSGRIAVKAINHLGDEVMKVFRVSI